MGLESLLPAGLSRTHLRLGGFIALSIALHLLTVAGAGRFDLTSQRMADASAARTELHATLAPPTPVESASATRGDAGASGESAPPAVAPEQAPRPGTEGQDAGIALPAAEKWYTASEVDVRAEPTAGVRLRYPEDLRSEPVVGKVRLRLFIDERGVVRKMQVTASEPAGMFDQAARNDWEHVVFSPALKDGRPVKSQKLLELVYQPGLM